MFFSFSLGLCGDKGWGPFCFHLLGLPNASIRGGAMASTVTPVASATPDAASTASIAARGILSDLHAVLPCIDL